MPRAWGIHSCRLLGVSASVDHALVQMVSGERGTAVVREAVDLLSATLLSHLSYEERELIPALSRHGFS